MHISTGCESPRQAQHELWYTKNSASAVLSPQYMRQSHHNFSLALNQNTCLYAGVYTIEASFLGGEEGSFKGLHYTSVDYEEIGASICRAILDFSDRKKQASTLEVVAKDQDGVGNENSSDSVCCGMHVYRRSMRFV